MDFVLIWVDGNDPEWQDTYRFYSRNTSGDKREIRFRDWESLRFWFRGVEKFAPWVNKIHFVTCGHVPEWLNLSAPKLHFVKHTDYIPQEFLPTFNSHTIELHLHRIEGLAEQFVYFNDDVFLMNPIRENYFFKNGYPCDCAILNTLSANGIGNIILNDIQLINKNFDKKKVLTEHFGKWFNRKYRKEIIRNFCLLPWPQFTGFIDPHSAVPYLKSTFEEVWKAEGESLISTCRSRFREISNVNQYVMRYWQLVSGNFVPADILKGITYTEFCDENPDYISTLIQNFKKSILILNDGEISDFNKVREIVNRSFEFRLPEKSQFEK